MHPHHEGLLIVAAIEDADAAAFRETFHAPPEIIVVEVFAGGRLEGKDLATLRVDTGHDVLDRAVLPGGVHRLEDQQHRPAVLRVKHVLKLGQQIDAHGKRLLGARLVLGCEVERVAGVDILQAKAVIGHAERLGELARLLDQIFHLFVVHGFTSFFVSLLFFLFTLFYAYSLRLTFYVGGEGLGAGGRGLGCSIAKRNIFSTSARSCLRSFSSSVKSMRTVDSSFSNVSARATALATA